MKLIKPFLSLLDLIAGCLLFIFVIPFLALKVIFLTVICRGFVRRNTQERKFLRFNQGSYELCRKKGVLSLLFDDGNFFDHVYFVSFPADKDNIINFDSRYTFIDIGKKGYFLKKTGMNFSHAVFNLFVFFWFGLNLSVKVRREVSLIRATDPHHMGLVAIVLNFITEVPYCISLHSNYDLIFQSHDFFNPAGLRFVRDYLRKLIERFVCSFAGYVLCISKFISEYALSSGAKKSSIRIIRHGVDLSLFEPPLKKDRSIYGNLGKYLIAVVSRIHKEKRIFDIVDIADQLRSNGLDFTIIVAGDGPDREELEEKIKQFDLGDKIKLLGYLDKESVVVLRRLADVNLCFFDGYSLIEAALSAKPVVAYDVEWHSELIKENETGLMVSNGDTHSAALAISRLVDNPDLSLSIGTKARKIASEFYSKEASSLAKLKVYQEIIQSSSFSKT